MKEIDLSKYNTRTDLIIDGFLDESTKKALEYKRRKIDKDIFVEEFIIDKNLSKKLAKKEGKYISISFKDVTDSDNYNNVLDTLTKELTRFLKELKLDQNKSCLIVGLGNRRVSPDAIGPKVLDNIIVTHHLLEFASLEKNYRDVSILEPSVKGITGYDTSKHIKSMVNLLKPDFLIIIDSLMTNKIDRLLKTIQISNTYLTPGSAINKGNDNINIKTLAIGVPTVTDSITISYDTIYYFIKKIEKIKNKKLDSDDKKDFLGLIGNLEEVELKKLFEEILTPLDYNMIVTTKEIDFIVEKLSKIISEAINLSLHKIKRQN